MFLLYFCLLTFLGYANSIQVDFTREYLWISPKNEFLNSSDVNETGYVDGSSDLNLEWKKSLESENILMANFSLNYLGRGKNTNIKLDVCIIYGYYSLEYFGLEFFNKIFGTEWRVEQCPISKNGFLTMPGIIQWSQVRISGLTCEVDAIMTLTLMEKFKPDPIAKVTYRGQFHDCSSTFK